MLGELGEAAAKVPAELKRDVAEIRRGYDTVIKWKTDLDCVVRGLLVRPFACSPVPACFFQGNIPLRWTECRGSLNESVVRLLSRLAA